MAGVVHTTSATLSLAGRRVTPGARRKAARRMDRQRGHLLSVASESPWYANIGPDPETLVKAHADFAKMILTLRPSRTTRRRGTDR